MMTDVPEAADESRDQLERERDFLLRSLDDLERERDKGTIDDESYERLHADYTARAAAVIRALRDGVDSRPVAPPISNRRRLLTIGVIVGFAVIAAVVLAAALGARHAGETSSGNTNPEKPSATISMAGRIDRLQRAVAANPDDQASRLLLARFLEADGDYHGALKQYDEVLQRNPSNAEAEAQAGRILYLTAEKAVKDAPDQVESLVQQSRARLDHSVSLDPEYADARFFRAIVLANEYGDFAAAQNDLQRYLILAPSGPFANDARTLLAQVTNALDGTPIPTTAPPTGKNGTKNQKSQNNK
jgi:cytochrome c-type biogenesis protein CcmH/NrfG